MASPPRSRSLSRFRAFLTDRLWPATLDRRVVLVMTLGAVSLTLTIALAAAWAGHRQQVLSDAYAFGVELNEILTMGEDRLGRGLPPHMLNGAAGGPTVRWAPAGKPVGFPYDRPPQRLPLPAAATASWPQGLRVHFAELRLSQTQRERLTTALTPTAYLAVLSQEVARLGVPAMLEVTLSDGSGLLVGHPRLWTGRFRPAAVVLGFIGTLAVVIAVFGHLARRMTRPFTALARTIAAPQDLEDPTPLSLSGPLELRTVITAYNDLRRRAAVLVTERGQMLAAISHDLRTPGTRLRLRAEFIDDPEVRDAILADLDQMDQLIAETLDLLRGGLVRENQRQVDVESLVQSVCDDYADCGHPVVFRGPPPLVFRRVPTLFGGEPDSHTFDDHRAPRLYCRPNALRRALTNLIDNALKYGRRARVELDADSETLTLSVHDEGPGIPEEAWDAVFLPFHRLDRSRASATGGTGLGLAIVKSAVDAHQGRVTLANRPAGGLSITITLPRRQPPAPEEQEINPM